MHSRVGYIHGTGAAINVELGYIPDHVKLVNLTDGDLITEAWLHTVVAFTSGGTTEIKKGDTITGLTNTGVSAVIKEVILDSGSWAGGDAAGWFIISPDDMTGTFGSENAELNGNGTNSVTVAAGAALNVATAAAVASATGNAAISAYVGDEDSGYAKGFTVGSTVSENAKLIGYIAMRNGAGEDRDALVAGVAQSTAW